LLGAFACLVPPLLAACEGTGVLKTASLSTSVTLGNFSSSHTEGTSEIYSRVARGAKACWFGAGKPLEETHVFEGKLDPESEGGAAEVAVHVRTPDQPNPRGGKVFIVSITKEGEGSSLVTENRRLPEPLAHTMRTDVAGWAKTGSVECSVLDVANPISTASIAPALPERKPVAKKAKGKKK
jgi:hypothetical protein